MPLCSLSSALGTVPTSESVLETVKIRISSFAGIGAGWRRSSCRRAAVRPRSPQTSRLPRSRTTRRSRGRKRPRTSSSCPRPARFRIERVVQYFAIPKTRSDLKNWAQRSITRAFLFQKPAYREDPNIGHQRLEPRFGFGFEKMPGFSSSPFTSLLFCL